MIPINSAVQLLLWIVVVLQGVMIMGLIHQLAELRRKVEAASTSLPANPYPIDSDAPTFWATDLKSGARLHSSSLRGNPRLLLFLTTDCTVCRKLAKDLGRHSRNDYTNLVVYCHGASRGCNVLLGSLSDAILVLRKDEESVSELFNLSGYPAAVLLDANLRVVGYRYPTRITHVLESLSQLSARPSGTEEGTKEPITAASTS